MFRTLFPFLFLALGILQLSGQTVSSFTLINADNDQDIATLQNGDTLTFSQLPTTNLNVRANTTPSTVGSVIFDLNGQVGFRTENGAPYALAGDVAGNYNPWTPPFGSNTLVGRAYSGASGAGTTGGPFTVNFYVRSSLPGGGVVIGGTLGQVDLSGEMKRWHPVFFDLTGPYAFEDSSLNPFSDYRFDVVFTKGARSLVVPGFFAADGNAANTSANRGNIWRCIFTPDETGTWNYRVLFRTDTDIATSTDTTLGQRVLQLEGLTGSFSINETDKSSPDIRGKGFLLPRADQHYHQFQDGEYFIKAGPNSPENVLAYYEFDNTYRYGGTPVPGYPDGLHHLDSHLPEWQPGDPVWQSTKGKRLIGGVNYLASKGLNTLYFISMKNNGTADVNPWTAPNNIDRYDVSKVAQWDIFLQHMNNKGLLINFLFFERQNDKLLNNGDLLRERRIYYREMVARFGHNLAIQWNQSEETTLNATQRTAVFAYLKDLDPYNHPVLTHNNIGTGAGGVLVEDNAVYGPHVGDPNFDGASLQGRSNEMTHDYTLKWVNNSAAGGVKWAVCVDEPWWQGPALKDGPGNNHQLIVREVLWGNLLAGGAGIEWYFGSTDDYANDDWHNRDSLFSLSYYPLDFFRTYLRYWEMQNLDGLTTRTDDFVFGKEGDTYVAMIPNGGALTLNLVGFPGTYSVYWFNPRTGGDLLSGTVTQVAGGANIAVGAPPFDTNLDWVVMVHNDAIPFPNQKPQPDFTVTPPAGIAPLLATMDANASFDSDGTIVQYVWDFGDGNQGTGLQPQHTYASPGEYSIILTATDDDGAVNATSKKIYVYAPGTLPPSADFVFTNSLFSSAPVTISFDASASEDLDGTIVSYLWNFGDGYVGTGVTPNHVFGWEGSFDIQLIVIDNDGNRDTLVSTFVVDDPCIATDGFILWEYWNGIGGSAVSNLTSNINYPGNPSGSDELPLFQGPSDFNESYGSRVRGYLTPPVSGSYTFTVTSDDGSEVYLSTDASAANKQLICSVNGWTGAAEFTKYPTQVATPVTLTAGQKYYVELIHKEGGGGDHFALWWKGPGIATETIVPGSVLKPFTYCTKIPPISAFTSSATSGNAPLIVNFDGSAASDQDGSLVNRIWDFGDGNTGSGTTPNHTFNQAGTYTVRYTVVDNDGLRSLSTQIITIIGNTLPVEWLDIRANQEGGNIRVIWAVADEQQVAGYQLERSIDGWNFQRIGEVSARNEPGILEYAALDYSPLAGKNRYRVLQTDINGQQSYSASVEVTFNSPEPRVFPVPNSPSKPLTVEFFTSEKESIELELHNMLGQVVFSQKLQPNTSGKHQLAIPMQHMAQGVYLLRMTRHDGSVYLRKVVLDK